MNQAPQCNRFCSTNLMKCDNLKGAKHVVIFTQNFAILILFLTPRIKIEEHLFDLKADCYQNISITISNSMLLLLLSFFFFMNFLLCTGLISPCDM